MCMLRMYGMSYVNIVSYTYKVLIFYCYETILFVIDAQSFLTAGDAMRPTLHRLCTSFVTYLLEHKLFLFLHVCITELLHVPMCSCVYVFVSVWCVCLCVYIMCVYIMHVCVRLWFVIIIASQEFLLNALGTQRVRITREMLPAAMGIRWYSCPLAKHLYS